MTQELTDLKNSILQGRYQEALAIVEELEAMSRKDYIRKIKSYLIRLLIHLIKNQIEQRLTNSWAASIRDSIVEIQDLNLMNNQTYYIKQNEWPDYLNKVLDTAISRASLEVEAGKHRPNQLKKQINTKELLETAIQFLKLTEHPDNIESLINAQIAQLVGGEDWNLD